MRIPFIAGNWKMFKNQSEAVAFAEEFKKLYKDTDVRTAICAPFTDLAVLKEILAGTNIGLGAQNVHYEEEGAFTGEISAKMLEEIGVDYCIVGHSERRQYFSETDEAVNLKLKRLLKGPIRPILCVGESLKQRDEGMLFDVVRGQVEKDLEGIAAEEMERVVIAYEPIWAIGTGRTATPQQAEEMCGFIRQVLIDIYGEETADKVILQYGGSVKPANAGEIMNMDEIDGALVGGASLKAEDFMAIIDF